ncbi:mechanosensitive ion channel family protein, partial [Acinetobacter baumannii]|nr:mechanosensitive ion channel family protein [Acinetobacter baumannii]
MDFFNFYRDLQAELSNYPWLEMLVSLTLLILFAALANFIAKRIIVRGIRHLVTKIKSLNQSVFAQHSVIKRFANIVPAIVIMNGITTVPHLSEKAVALVQMGAQAFIFLTIALTISEL